MKKSPEAIFTLIAEIEAELTNITLLKGEITTAEKNLKKTSKKKNRYITESLALRLHNFYTAYERIFEKIAGEIDGRTPQGIDWHKRLLKSMTLNINGVRPPVLNKDTEKEIEEYLKFRHLVRNIYGFELEEEKMIPLIKGIEKVTKDFMRDIKRFLTFLKALTKV